MLTCSLPTCVPCPLPQEGNSRQGKSEAIGPSTNHFLRALSLYRCLTSMHQQLLSKGCRDWLLQHCGGLFASHHLNAPLMHPSVLVLPRHRQPSGALQKTPARNQHASLCRILLPPSWSYSLPAVIQRKAGLQVENKAGPDETLVEQQFQMQTGALERKRRGRRDVFPPEFETLKNNRWHLVCCS